MINVFKKMPKSKNTLERAYLDQVAQLGCCMCQLMDYGETPAQIHHVREGQGMGQRAQHFAVVPLCPEHHTGTHGWHGDRAEFKRHSIDEIDMLAWVNERLFIQ